MLADETFANCLEGVRVLDFSRFESGPTCTQTLAWLGASVVKAEAGRGGDPGRAIGRKGADPYGAWFQEYNSNKQSIALNLRSTRGIELARALAAEADVVVENFAPGRMEEMGLGYDSLVAVNPGLVFAEIKGFGPGSAYEKYLAFDGVGQATGGVMSVTGEPGGRPIRAGLNIADSGSGMLMVTSILGALNRKARTGQGARLRLSMQDAVMHFLRGAFASQLSTGSPPKRAGSGGVSVANVPSDTYLCSPEGPNDFIFIYTRSTSSEHWHRLLHLIGRPELIGDPRLETAAARVANVDEVNAMITAWTRTLTKQQAMQALGDAQIPAGPVLDTRDLLADNSFAERGLFQDVAHPSIEDLRVQTWPVEVDDRLVRVLPAPLLGEHTEVVLRDWLALSDAEIAGLISDGIATQAL